ncbi:GerAB/ArcD/ProY family transporter [Paenibacillus frigoriresistens]|uniref:GerAB/ArcD/ProY family transporter n=1 Tax=Paenibacillus alginolyticus TaxID=59839 RepID=UPI0015631B2A|nr:GerAB/ArcD/ProY family transporter [Paenibacillus frigoriresistens]NRF96054.1 GerAB/ArcD/ProY family transporter [Paenibacillus frigoriresistens]
MRAFSLYDKTSSYNGVYVVFIVNRLQMLYLFTMLPKYLVHPYMIWGIVAVGILSQLNLMILSKWFRSDFSAKGYQGFVELFGEWAIRFFTCLAVVPILLKITVVTSGCADLLQYFIFPTMDIKWLMLAILLISCYVASLGMEKTIRFVVIVFLCSAWIILLLLPFFFPPLASLKRLYPLIPTEWPMDSWKGLLYLWSSFSGPEYLICIAPWLSSKQKLLKYLTIGNAVSVTEYLYLFVSSLFFYGSNRVSYFKYPIVQMSRYMQFPIFEREDIILISLHMFTFVLAISFFLLFIYGAGRIVAGRVNKQSTRIGFMTICLVIFVCTIMINKWSWRDATGFSLLLSLQIWVGAFTYLLVPSLLLITTKIKERFWQ